MDFFRDLFKEIRFFFKRFFSEIILSFLPFYGFYLSSSTRISLLAAVFSYTNKKTNIISIWQLNICSCRKVLFKK